MSNFFSKPGLMVTKIPKMILDFTVRVLGG